MRFIGSMNFYSQFINKLHISLKPFFTLLHDDVSFEWTSDLDKLFNEIELSLSKDADLANANSKMQVISYNSRILTTQE